MLDVDGNLLMLYYFENINCAIVIWKAMSNKFKI